jgi:serine/threonine protein kinase
MLSLLSVLKQVASALEHLHSLGILHRDLRAGNILIDSVDPLHVVVADLGVSHQLRAFAEGRHTGTVSGLSTVLKDGAALGPLQVRKWARVDLLL